MSDEYRRKGWDDSRRHIASAGHEQEELMREIEVIEDEEVERNRHLKKQLVDLQSSRRRREVGELATSHTASIKAMEIMFEQQTESLSRLIGTGLAASPPPPPPPPPPVAAAAPPPPQHVLATYLPPPSTAAAAAASPVPAADHARRAVAAEAAAEQLRRELREARDEARHLADELAVARQTRAEADRHAAALQAQLDQLCAEGLAQGAYASPARSSAARQPQSLRKGRSPSATGARSPSPTPHSPATDEHLRLEVRRLKAKLADKESSERLLNKRIQQLANTPFSSSRLGRPLKFS